MCYFGRLKGLSGRDARAFSLDYLQRVGLADKAGVRLETLSGGQQQKVQLCVTIMDRPELLILDELTEGLDRVNSNLLDDSTIRRSTTENDSFARSSNLLFGSCPVSWLPAARLRRHGGPALR